MTGTRLDLEGLGFEQGAHILVDRALRSVPAGGRLRVVGHDPALAVHLRVWCRSRGHGFTVEADGGQIEPGPAHGR